MRPQPVDRAAGGDGDEPGARVVDGRGVLVEQAQIGILHDVLGVGDRAQHAVGDVAHQVAVLVPPGLDHGVSCGAHADTTIEHERM